MKKFSLFHRVGRAHFVVKTSKTLLKTTALVKAYSQWLF